MKPIDAVKALLFSMIFISATVHAAAVGAQVTSYNQMVIELTHDEHLSPLIHLSTIGYSAKGKRPILLVRVGLETPGNARIMILCRQHGDEPSGTEAAIQYINRISDKPDVKKQLKKVCLYFIPMVNPDGAVADTRLSGVGADLNRDWGKFEQPETAAVQRAVLFVRPEFILDVHSWDMIDPFQQVCLEGPREAQVSPTLRLAVADLQARASYGLEAKSKQMVAATTYGQFSEPTLAHRFFLKSDHIASLLFETAPGLNYGTSLASRTDLVESLFTWLVADTSLHQDAWKRLAASEPQRMDVSSTNQLPALHYQQIVITQIRKAGFESWTPFGLACLLSAWIALKRRSKLAGAGLNASSRYRRSGVTCFDSARSTASNDRKRRRRNAAERAALMSELQFRNKVHFSRGGQRPGSAGAA